MSAAAQGQSGKGNQLAARGPQPVNAGWTLVAMVLTATILSWLFLQADAISTTEHQRYARNLRALHQADAELNAAVLASRLGVQTDFDTIVASITTLHRLGEKLENVPDFLPNEDRFAVLSNVNAFRSTLEHKVDRIDLFKRELSVLRNSLSFLPLAADQLIEDPAAPIAET
ncbi:MAG: GGDEF domain-containing protein, partial [Betaproteobacteria bacterium HGW-Betaproteobacteria-19]